MPFIDMMCRFGEWIEALGQANARLTWCTSRYQADWKHDFGELLCQHVISDAVGYKLEVIFGIEPVSLLSILCISTTPHREADCTTIGFSVSVERRRLFFLSFLVFLGFPFAFVFFCFPLFFCFYLPAARLLQRFCMCANWIS